MAAPFCLVKEPAAWWPVHFDVPADGGAVRRETLELKFVRLGRADFNATFVKAAEGEVDDAANRTLFDRVVKDWRGIADADGNKVPFADPWIEQLLDVPGVPEAFGRAYAAFWAGQPEAVLGNSAPSHGGGAATAEPQLETTGATTSRPPSRTGGHHQKK